MEKSQGKVRGSEIRCVISSSKYSKTGFSAGAPPRTPLGELTTLPQTPSRLGRGTPHPLPPAVTTQTVNMKQRLLSTSVNTRYWVIFTCLYWKSQRISCGLESGHPDWGRRFYWLDVLVLLNQQCRSTEGMIKKRILKILWHCWYCNEYFLHFCLMFGTYVSSQWGFRY